jgi:hypothetical protein
MAIVEIKREVNQTVVEILEKALANVRAGDTVGVLLLEKKVDVCSWSNAGLKDRFEVIGYLEHAKHRMQGDE